MGFSWTNIDSNTIITNEQRLEIRQNIDTATTELGITAYSWQYNPGDNDKITTSQFSELQDAVDYLDTNNVCTANYSTHDQTVESSYHINVESAKDVGVDSNYQGGVDNNRHGAYRGSANSNEDGCTSHYGYHSPH